MCTEYHAYGIIVKVILTDDASQMMRRKRCASPWASASCISRSRWDLACAVVPPMQCT